MNYDKPRVGKIRHVSANKNVNITAQVSQSSYMIFFSFKFLTRKSTGCNSLRLNCWNITQVI